MGKYKVVNRALRRAWMTPTVMEARYTVSDLSHLKSYFAYWNFIARPVPNSNFDISRVLGPCLRTDTDVALQTPWWN